MRVLADETRVAGLIDNLAGSIAARMDDAGGDGWALIGVRSRGDELARRLARRLDPARIQGRVGVLDITLYRDDLTEIGPQPVVRTTEVGFSLDGLSVVLVDDVLMTGRSVRAGLQSLMDLGRPRRVWLSVLVDRGGRELPICPDDVGLDLGRGGEDGVGPGQTVRVSLRPGDDRDAITVADDADRGARGTAP